MGERDERKDMSGSKNKYEKIAERLIDGDLEVEDMGIREEEVEEVLKVLSQLKGEYKYQAENKKVKKISQLIQDINGSIVPPDGVKVVERYTKTEGVIPKERKKENKYRLHITIRKNGKKCTTEDTNDRDDRDDKDDKSRDKERNQEKEEETDTSENIEDEVEYCLENRGQLIYLDEGTKYEMARNVREKAKTKAQEGRYQDALMYQTFEKEILNTTTLISKYSRYEDQHETYLRELENTRIRVEIERSEEINKCREESRKNYKTIDNNKYSYNQVTRERRRYKPSRKIIEMRACEKALSRNGYYEEAEYQRRRTDRAEEEERRVFEMDEDSLDRRNAARNASIRERQEKIAERILEDKIAAINAKYDRRINNLNIRIKEAAHQVEISRKKSGIPKIEG